MEKLYSYSKQITENGICYKSGLEFKYKTLLEQLGIKAIHEPATFKTGKYFSNGTEICYTPDFYLCDENVYVEVKPNNDKTLQDGDIQQKISAAMDNNRTPVGHGLLIFGEIEGFNPRERNGADKVFLWGEFYQWCFGSIEKSYWGLGAENEDAEVKFFFSDPKFEDDFPRYPRFATNPSAKLWHSYDDPRASKILWRALRAAMYAVQNFEKNDEMKGD